MMKSRIFGFVVSVALAIAGTQAVARIGDPPKNQTTTVKKSEPTKKSDSGSKGSFGMSSSGGNSRSDLAAQVKAREEAQRQAQQAAARKAQDDAARAHAAQMQQQQLAQQQAERARIQQAQAAEQARQESIRAQQMAQQSAQREAQRLADQNEAQARLIRQQQRALEAQQDALRYRNSQSYGGGYVSAEEAARRARNGTLAGAAGGAAVGGVIGYEMGKHSADGNVQVQPGQVYQQAPVAPAPTVATSPAPVSTAPVVAPVVSQEKSSGGGFGTFLVVVLLIAGGVGIFVFLKNKKSSANPVVNSYQPTTTSYKEPTEATSPVSSAPVYDNRPAQDAELIQDVTEFFSKLQGYYNEKNAEALTALTSSQMLTSIKEAFVTGGHVITEFSNVYVSLEEVKDTEVSALIEADAREVVDGEVTQYRLREIWTMKREAFGLVLDGITRLD